MTQGLSVHFGLNAIDRNHYAGWNGRLLAAENDANDMQAIAASVGFDTLKRLGRNCTRQTITQAFEEASRLLRSGDIFLLTYSGHGAQLRDQTLDEDDFYDETLCLYDGQWIDDETRVMLRKFSRGVRILLIFDCCNAGTMSKFFDPERSLGLIQRAMPIDIAIETYKEHESFYRRIRSVSHYRASSLDPLSASVMTIGASEDSRSAADGQRNGLFTAALRTTWNQGMFRGNYSNFVDQIRRQIPRQYTSFLVEGPERDSFRSQQPFEIEGKRQWTLKSSVMESYAKRHRISMFEEAGVKSQP